jgi:hypothetical protein
MGDQQQEGRQREAFRVDLFQSGVFLQRGPGERVVLIGGSLGERPGKNVQG